MTFPAGPRQARHQSAMSDGRRHCLASTCLGLVRAWTGGACGSRSSIRSPSPGTTALQSLAKPVNDLSWGALVDDVIYTITLTVV
jgi:hypothetical protein